MRKTYRVCRLVGLPSFAFALSIFAGCGKDDGPTAVSEVPARTAISWNRCGGNTTGTTLIAVQDGTGPWRSVTESNGAIAFTLDSARAGVAYVTSLGSTIAEVMVRFYTAAEFRDLRPLCDVAASPSGTKTVNGSVRLGVSENAEIVFGGSEASAFGTTGTAPIPFALFSVRSVAADLIATKKTYCPATSCLTPTAVIIRRNLNPPDGSTLPVLDFSDVREAFVLVPRTLTVQGLVSGEILSVEEAFSTATEASGVTLLTTAGTTATSSSVAVPYFAIPDERLVDGDVHQVFLSAQASDGEREAVVNLHSAKDQALTLGPALPAVTVTTGRSGNAATLTAQVASTGFKSWIGEYVQGNVDVLVRVSAGYVRNGSVNIGVPNLSGVSGWLPSWGLQAGSVVNWNVGGVDVDIAAFDGTSPDRIPAYQGAMRQGRVTP